MIVFLDVDGVLNFNNTCEKAPSGYRGIDFMRVKILADAIEKCGGATIVLTSDWKGLKEDHEDYLYLQSKLAEYGLTIAGSTVDKGPNRGEGIQNYLKEHPEEREYVILDDHEFDFRKYENLWEHVILTNGIEKAETASQTPVVEAMLFADYIAEE